MSQERPVGPVYPDSAAKTRNRFLPGLGRLIFFVHARNIQEGITDVKPGSVSRQLVESIPRLDYPGRSGKKSMRSSGAAQPVSDRRQSGRSGNSPLSIGFSLDIFTFSLIIPACSKIPQKEHDDVGNNSAKKQP
jgi:hypothetical protein